MSDGIQKYELLNDAAAVVDVIAVIKLLFKMVEVVIYRVPGMPRRSGFQDRMMKSCENIQMMSLRSKSRRR